MVTGQVTTVRKTAVQSEHGEPLAWKTSESLTDRATYALCRCGDSDNKPFCDGAHAKVGFEGIDTADESTYDDRASELGGTGIVVSDDRSICVHAGFCGNEVTNVWKMAAKTGDTRIRAQAMAMIERCPSGALTYHVGGEEIEPDLPLEVAVIIDGPLWVSGGVTVTRADGTELESRNRVTLCRCGQSGVKPMCDGSHKEAGFTG